MFTVTNMDETSPPITCFNGEECIYEKCPLYAPSIDTCKLELLKQKPGAQRKTQPRSGSPPKQQTVDGVRSIGSLTAGEKSSKDNKITIQGSLVTDPDIKDVNTQRGPTEIAKLLLMDDTGQIQLTYWGDEVKNVKNYRAGQTLRVENVWKIDSPYDDIPQATPGKYSKITVVS